MKSWNVLVVTVTCNICNKCRNGGARRSVIINLLPRLFKCWIALSTIIIIQQIRIRESSCLINWIEIYPFRVCSLFERKKIQGLFTGLSRTHFPFFKESIQCKKEPWVLSSSSTTWVILSRRSFCVCSFSFGVLIYKVKRLSSTDCNFQGLSSTCEPCYYYHYQFT